MKRKMLTFLAALLAAGLLTVPAGAVHAHQWDTGFSYNTEFHWRQCLAEDCDIPYDRIDRSQDYGPHVLSDWTVIQAGGERTAGKRERTCSVCGYTQTEVIPAQKPTADAFTLDLREGPVSLEEGERTALQNTLLALSQVTVKDIHLQGPPEGFYYGLDGDEGGNPWWDMEQRITYKTNVPPDQAPNQIESICYAACPGHGKPAYLFTLSQEEADTLLRRGVPFFGSVTILLDRETEPAPPAGPVLSDLSGHWAREAVSQAVDQGWVNGYPDGTFRPEQTVSRAEMTKMLLAAVRLTPDSDGVRIMIERRAGDPLPPFGDLADSWLTAQGWTGAARASGLLVPDDYPDRNLVPDQAITRGEIAVLADRALGLVWPAKQESAQESPFADRDAFPAFQAGYIREASRAGIINGYPDGTFGPDRTATRAEAVTMVARVLEQMDRGEPASLKLTFWEGEDRYRTVDYPGTCLMRDDTVYVGLTDFVRFIFREDRINTDGDDSSMLLRWEPLAQNWWYEWGISSFGYTAGQVPHYYNDPVYHAIGESEKYGRTPAFLRYGEMMIPLHDCKTGQDLTQWPTEWADGTLTLHAGWAFSNGS